MTDTGTQTRSTVARILAVDDQPKNLLALEAMLEPLGQPIISASSGKEALRYLLNEDFALILLDVQMPELDGYETAQLIRARAKSRHIPIIFLTAIHRDPELISKGYAAGAVDYMLKPIEPEILRAKAAVFIELHKKSAIIREQAEQLQRASQREFADYKRWSEDRYTTLADAMPQIVWTASPTGDLLYCNKRWMELADDSAKNDDWANVLHPDELNAFRAGLAIALKSQEPWEAEFRFGNGAQGYRWHLVRMAPKFDADKRLLWWIGTSTDIDARKRAEQHLTMLARLTDRLGLLLDEGHSLQDVLNSALPDLGDCALVDLREPTQTQRRVAATCEGWTRPSLEDPRFDLGPTSVSFTGRSEIYMDVVEELNAATSGRGAEHLRFLAELGISSYMCLPLVVRDRVFGTLTLMNGPSERKYTETECTLARDVARRLATALDNVRLYELAQSERNKIEETSRAKDLFLATVSHELRTPLNAIVGWGHMLRTGGLNAEKQRRAIDTIERNGRALAQLVADLLDVSRIVAGNLKLEEKPLDMRSIVEATVDAARPSAEAAGVTLSAELGDKSVDVLGDPQRLQQVIGNIIGNAIKFTPHGKVSIRLETAEGRAKVLVTDTGQGISPEFLPQVFDRFKQAAENRPRAQGGLGLGLAIVKHIVDLHQGGVVAESEGIGKGSTFSVDLPLRSSESSGVFPQQNAERKNTASQPPSEIVASDVLRGIHALVVEDDPDGCELIEAVLRGFGATVTAVSSASAAMDAMHDKRPDVLVSDIGLPDADGFELLRQVRSDAKLTTLPAIAVTAFASRQDVAKALAHGFQAHVSKPVEPAQLGAAIARVSGR